MKITRPRLEASTILSDRYQIIDELGEGGMQQVFLANDKSLGKKVALKVPISASATKRFERSARFSARISHPNVAKTLDYMSVGELEFLVEEFIPGTNLQQRLDEGSILDPHLVAHIMHHVAKAVSAMNACNIIHRDLKPSNIMVSGDLGMLDVKITDFGVATMAETEIEEAVNGGSDSIAASKTVVGALAFMAPQLIIKNSDGAARAKCDVWSIGALLYYLLFREYPFGDGLAAIPNILTGKYRNRSKEVEGSKIQFRDLFRQLWELARRCLTVAVENRPSADEIAEAFSQISYAVQPRFAGRIKYIHPQAKSWGFISPEGGGEDIFFHFDSFYGDKPVTNPALNMRVSYAEFAGVPKSRAFPVVLAAIR